MTDEATLVLPPEYAAWLTGIKQSIQRAALAANGEQIGLYHYIGREILARQGEQGWGARAGKHGLYAIDYDLDDFRRELNGITAHGR